MQTADTVNSWFRDRLSSGPIARDTEAYNQLVEALPDLVTRLTPAPAATQVADATPAAEPNAAPAAAG